MSTLGTEQLGEDIAISLESAEMRQGKGDTLSANHLPEPSSSTVYC